MICVESAGSSGLDAASVVQFRPGTSGLGLET